LSGIPGKSAGRGSARPRSSVLVASVLVRVHAPRSAPLDARSAIVAERPPGPDVHANAAMEEPRRSNHDVRTSAAGSHEDTPRAIASSGTGLTRAESASTIVSSPNARRV